MGNSLKKIWVFNGANSRFASGVFTERPIAESWIKRNKLTGVLTLYPIDIGVYEWAISSGTFYPKKEVESEPEFIQKFTSASQEHYHYEGGELD